MLLKCSAVFLLTSILVFHCHGEQAGSSLLPYLLRGLDKCSAQGGLTGVINCAGFKTLKMLARVSNEEVLQLTPGIQFIKDTNHTDRRAKQLDMADISAFSAMKPLERTTHLLKSIISTSSDLFSGRTLKIKLPETAPNVMARALEEGRAKIKKIVNPFMSGIGRDMLSLVPVALGGLALLTSKALLVSKVALAAAVFLLLRYLFPPTPPPNFLYGSNGYGTSYGAPVSGIYGSAQYPYARSLDVTGETIEGPYKNLNTSSNFQH